MNRNLYGSSLIGQEEIYEVIASTDNSGIDINTNTDMVIGDKRYTLSNHLGNQNDTCVLPNKTLSRISPDWSGNGTSGVHQVVTDRKIPEEDNGNLAYFYPNVVSYFTSGDNVVENAGDCFFTADQKDKKGNPIKKRSSIKVNDVEVNSGEISWYPYSSIKFNDCTILKSGGGVDNSTMNASISPANALGHEIGHAYQSFYMTVSFIRGVKPDSQYGNKKERFAIEAIEHSIAKELGEGIRKTHQASEKKLNKNPWANL